MSQAANGSTREDLVRLAQSLLLQAELLSSAALIPATGERSKRDESVYELLKRASELSRGAGAVGAQGNAVALGVLSRAILENLILILWVEVSDDNASDLQATGVREMSRVLRINLENGKAHIRNRNTGKDSTKEFLESGRLDNLRKRRTVQSQAKEAGIEDLYNVFYRFLSLDMHGHGDVLSGKEAIELACVHMQGIGAICKATGHAGVRWLLHRERTDNESLRGLLGFEVPRP